MGETEATVLEQGEISVDELVEALSDPERLQELMKKYDLSREQVLARAEIIAKELAEGVQHVNVV